MCTNIGAKVRIAGSAKAGEGWRKVNEANVGYDHATQVWAEHSLRLDFIDTATPDREPVALEMDIASGRALIAQIEEVIAAAERGGFAE